MSSTNKENGIEISAPAIISLRATIDGCSSTWMTQFMADIKLFMSSISIIISKFCRLNGNIGNDYNTLANISSSQKSEDVKKNKNKNKAQKKKIDINGNDSENENDEANGFKYARLVGRKLKEMIYYVRGQEIEKQCQLMLELKRKSMVNRYARMNRKDSIQDLTVESAKEMMKIQQKGQIQDHLNIAKFRLLMTNHF